MKTGKYTEIGEFLVHVKRNTHVHGEAFNLQTKATYIEKIHT